VTAEMADKYKIISEQLLDNGKINKTNIIEQWNKIFATHLPVLHQK
jgi:hypothetical protein